MLDIIDEHHGWVIGAFGIFFTDDSGATWRDATVDSQFVRISPFVSGGYFGLAERRKAASGWAANGHGQLYYTKNKGRTWNNANAPGNVAITDLSVASDKTWWLSGETPGMLHRTDEAGKTWTVRSLGSSNLSVRSLFFQDQQNGWAVGHVSSVVDGRRVLEGEVLHTSDGGTTWNVVRVGFGTPFFSRVFFSDSLHGWILGRDKVYRSDDGGQNWRESLSLPPLS